MSYAHLIGLALGAVSHHATKGAFLVVGYGTWDQTNQTNRTHHAMRVFTWNFREVFLDMKSYFWQVWKKTNIEWFCMGQKLQIMAFFVYFSVFFTSGKNPIVVQSNPSNSRFMTCQQVKFLWYVKTRSHLSLKKIILQKYPILSSVQTFSSFFSRICHLSLLSKTNLSI